MSDGTPAPSRGATKGQRPLLHALKAANLVRAPLNSKASILLLGSTRMSATSKPSRSTCPFISFTSWPSSPLRWTWPE
jgi:hypothetical protein